MVTAIVRGNMNGPVFMVSWENTLTPRWVLSIRIWDCLNPLFHRQWATICPGKVSAILQRMNSIIHDIDFVLFDRGFYSRELMLDLSWMERPNLLIVPKIYGWWMNFGPWYRVRERSSCMNSPYNRMDIRSLRIRTLHSWNRSMITAQSSIMTGDSPQTYSTQTLETDEYAIKTKRKDNRIPFFPVCI